MGYNIFKGTPLSAVEKGYSEYRSFEYDKRDGEFKMASNGQYYPKSLNIYNSVACKSSLA